MVVQKTCPQIIHVDDDPSILRLIKRNLGPAFDVHSQPDPDLCIDELIRTGSRLVILDIDLGPNKMSGLDLLKSIKRFDGGIHVIMLTGLVSIDTILTSMREGAEACLFKPLHDKQELLDVVNDSLRKHARWHASLHDLVMRKKELTSKALTSKELTKLA
ncbi:MAG: response regulator [Pirellulaceae bacterium]